jgi:hypothetical protein
MALDTLTAKANVGAGTDTLAGRSTAAGFVGAVMLVDPAGIEIAPALAANQETANDALASIDDKLTTLLSYHVQEDSVAVSGDRGMPALYVRQAADTTSTSADGDYTLGKVDEEGRIKVASKPASYADITGDITAIQATIGTPVAGGTVAGDVSRASNVMMFCSGTFAGINCTFEGSIEAAGDTNWFAVQAVRTNANTIETTTGALSAQPAYAWELSVNGLKRVRVRATARTSGTQSWRFVLGTYATEPIPAAQVSATQPVSGSVTATLAAATVLAADVGGQYRANATGAATIGHIVSAATTNAANLKASAGRVLGWNFANTTAIWQLVKLHNTASTPTAGVGVALTIGIPPNGINASPPGFGGVGFSSGIGRTIVTGAADTDATATTLNAVVGEIFYA